LKYKGTGLLRDGAAWEVLVEDVMLQRWVTRFGKVDRVRH
jgi:hypothetical protein